MRRNPGIVLLLVTAAQAAVSNVSIDGVTAQQAILDFSTANPGQCTVQIYVDSERSLAIDDTNEALFLGSTACNRPGAIVSGNRVWFVAGLRTSTKAADGTMHSRSLAALSAYYYTITDATTGATSQGQFTTTGITAGSLYPEPVPYDANGFGNAAYPKVDFSGTGQGCGNFIGADQPCTDPVSGVKYWLFTSPGGDGRLTDPGNGGQTLFTTPVIAAGNCDVPSNMVNNPAVNFAQCTGAMDVRVTAQQWTVPDSAQPVYPFGVSSANHWYTPLQTVDDAIAVIDGSASDSANSDNVLNACLWSPATSTCLGNTFTITLPVGSAQQFTVPHALPKPYWQDWGYEPDQGYAAQPSLRIWRAGTGGSVRISAWFEGATSSPWWNSAAMPTRCEDTARTINFDRYGNPLAPAVSGYLCLVSSITGSAEPWLWIPYNPDGSIRAETRWLGCFANAAQPVNVNVQGVYEGSLYGSYPATAPTDVARLTYNTSKYSWCNYQDLRTLASDPVNGGWYPSNTSGAMPDPCFDLTVVTQNPFNETMSAWIAEHPDFADGTQFSNSTSRSVSFANGLVTLTITPDPAATDNPVVMGFFDTNGNLLGVSDTFTNHFCQNGNGATCAGGQWVSKPGWGASHGRISGAPGAQYANSAIVEAASVSAVPVPTGISNVSTLTATAQQQVISFSIPASGLSNCTVAVYSDALQTTPVTDSDTTISANAQACNRGALNNNLSSIVNTSGGTTTVQFVSGLRGTRRSAATNQLVSMSLSPVTTYYFTISIPGSVYSGQFTTLNLPLSDSAPELMPFDSTAFGNVGVPNINWGDRGQVYNDPAWGTQLHRMTDAADMEYYAGGQSFTYALNSNGGWTNTANALSAGSSALATCNTTTGCSTTSTLALVAQITDTNYMPGGAWDPSLAYNDFLVRMWGSGTDANAANRTVSVCWSVDNQTCLTASQTITLPQTSAAFAGTAPQSWSVQSPWSGTSLGLTNITVTAGAPGTATVNFTSAPGLTTGQQVCINGIRDQSVNTAQGGNGLNGCHVITGIGATSVSFATNAYAGTYTDSELTVSPNFPQMPWASWINAPMHSQVGLRGGGTVTCSAGACSLSPSGSSSSFDPAWPAGTKLYIAGSAAACSSNLCTVSSMTDSTHVTLVEPLTISGASWNSANFSLLVRKTTSTGAVSLSAGYDFVFSSQYNAGLDGSGDICNSNYVTVGVDAAGNPLSESLQGYLCVANATSLSQARTPIYLFIPSTGETRLLARNYQASVSDYRAWIGWHPTQGNTWFVNYPGQSVFQVTYTGDFRALTPGALGNSTEPDTPEQLTFTDVFGGSGNDMGTQIANCRNTHTCQQTINSSVFTIPPVPPSTGAAIKGNYLLMTGGCSGCGQNSLGYYTLWNVSSTPATLAWAAYTFTQFPVGYAGIHAAIQFGTGQYVEAQLNASTGGGPMGEPFEATPVQVDKTACDGSAFTSNTAIAQTDGCSCPAGLSAQWQALGAKPASQGGVARCLRFHFTGDFCSTNATVAGSSAFPCPGGGSSNALVKPIGEGDEVVDPNAGCGAYATCGERMLVVQRVNGSGNSFDLVLFRYSSSTVTPNAGFSCGTYDSSEWTHSGGWTMYAQPYQACWGADYWINALDTNQGWTIENRNIVGSHSDFGPGSGGYTYAEAAYALRTNQPMPGQIGQAPDVNVDGSPVFGSTQLPDGYLQSYPSKRQQSALTPASEMDWLLDVRSYNPGAGNGSETPEGLFGNSVTLVSGTSHTYLITFAGNQAPDPKTTGFVGWAGYSMLGDASGPASAASFGDATPWRYCYAYKTGECVSGSAAANMYVSVPHDETSWQCTVNSYAFNAPCISNNYPYGFWVSQHNTTISDSLGEQSRRLTSALIAPGREYNFANAKTTPDGKWVQVQAQWLEGQRSDTFWMKLPPFPSTAAVPPSGGFYQIPVSIAGGAPYARVLFGYTENGSNPAALYCASRAEGCSTEGTPFSWVSSDSRTLLACSSGCTINVPAMAGRILFTQVQRLAADGSVLSSGPLQAVSVAAGSTASASAQAALAGPWDVPVLAVNRAGYGSTPVFDCAGCSGGPSQTAMITQNDMYQCPATPLVQSLCPGGQCCVEIQVNQEPCSTMPYTASDTFGNDSQTEPAAFPCTNTDNQTVVNPGWSKLQNAQVGDWMGEDNSGTNGDWESFLIVQKSLASGGNVNGLWLLRESNAAANANLWSPLGTHNLTVVRHPCTSVSGGCPSTGQSWSMKMRPAYEQGVGGFWQFPAAGGSPLPDNPVWANAQHEDGPSLRVAAAGSNSNSRYYGAIGGSYARSIFAPLNPIVPVAPAFGGSTASLVGGVQNYFGVAQTAGAAGAFPSLFLSWRHDNSASPGDPYQENAFCTYSAAQVSGSIYQLSSDGSATDCYGSGADPKRIPFLARANPALLTEVSGPQSASVFGQTPNSACYALNQNECVSGSAAGTYYVNLPGGAFTNGCTNLYATPENEGGGPRPCFYEPSPAGGRVELADASAFSGDGSTARILSYVHSIPGGAAQQSYPSWDPTGTFAFVSAGYLDGKRPDLLALYIPPNTTDSANRTTYRPVTLNFNGISGDSIRVCWGYAENAPAYDPTQGLFPMPRQEGGCSDATGAQPFLWSNEPQHATACDVSCSVTLNLIAGRVAYYYVVRTNGSTTSTSPLQVVMTN